MTSVARPAPRSAAMVRHDIVHSASTLLLGGALGVSTTWLVLAGVVPLGTDVPSAGRIALEVAAYVLCFDAYFYGLHRLLHTRALYRRVHAVHHRATQPTVATALAFHPLEALAILGFVPMALCLVPIHVVSLALVCAFLSTSILLAHATHDPFPDGWQRLRVLGWYVTPREHHVHHARRDCNYSATFSLFDRAFGTLHAGDTAAD